MVLELRNRKLISTQLKWYREFRGSHIWKHLQIGQTNQEPGSVPPWIPLSLFVGFMLKLVGRRLPWSAKTTYTAKGGHVFQWSSLFRMPPENIAFYPLCLHWVISYLLKQFFCPGMVGHLRPEFLYQLLLEWWETNQTPSGSWRKALFCWNTGAIRRKCKYLRVNQAGRGDTFTTFMKIKWLRAGRTFRHTWDVKKMHNNINSSFWETKTN